MRYREKKVDANLSRRSSAEEKSLNSSGAMDLMLKTLSKYDKSRFPSEETVARFTEEELTEAAVRALPARAALRLVATLARRKPIATLTQPTLA